MHGKRWWYGCAWIILLASSAWADSQNLAKVEETPQKITISREVSTHVFSRRTCNLTQVAALDSPLIEAPAPDLMLTDASGRVFDQNRADDGSIAVSTRDAEFVRLAGRFRPRTADGELGPTVRVVYNFRKADGFTVVTYTVDPGAKMRLRRLEIGHVLGAAGGIEPRYVQWVMPAQEPWWDNQVRDIRETGDGRYVTGKWAFAMVTDGKVGFQIETTTFERVRIGEGRDGPVTIDVRNGRPSISLTYINVRPGEEVTLNDPLRVTYAFTTMPFKRLQPYPIMYASDSLFDGKVYAQIGVNFFETWGFGYYPSSYTEERVAAYHRILGERQRYGIHCMYYIEGMWLDVTGHADYTPETVLRDRIIREGKGIDLGGPPGMCNNAPHWQELNLESCEHGIEEFNGDGIRVDSTHPLPCQNTRHGCSEQYSFQTIAFADFYRKLRNFLDEKSAEEGKKLFLLFNDADVVNASVAGLQDAFFPGEMAGEGYPPESRLNTIYTSLLYGEQCFYYNRPRINNIPLDKPKIFERALARAATVFCNIQLPAAGGLTNEEMAMWVKYMNPLKIFDTTGSDVIHPVYSDFGDYCSGAPEGIVPVIYSKPGKALMTLCNEGVEGGPLTLRLDARALGIGPEVLLFDTLSYWTVDARTGEDGWVEVTLPRPKPDDAHIYLLITRPDHPTVIWHDVATWKVEDAWDPAQDVLSIQARGAPATGGSLIVHMGQLDGSHQAEHMGSSVIGRVPIGFDEQGQSVAAVSHFWRDLFRRVDVVNLPTLVVEDRPIQLDFFESVQAMDILVKSHPELGLDDPCGRAVEGVLAGLPLRDPQKPGLDEAGIITARAYLRAYATIRDIYHPKYPKLLVKRVRDYPTDIASLKQAIKDLRLVGFWWDKGEHKRELLAFAADCERYLKVFELRDTKYLQLKSVFGETQGSGVSP